MMRVLNWVLLTVWTVMSVGMLGRIIIMLLVRGGIDGALDYFYGLAFNTTLALVMCAVIWKWKVLHRICVSILGLFCIELVLSFGILAFTTESASEGIGVFAALISAQLTLAVAHILYSTYAFGKTRCSHL